MRRERQSNVDSHGGSGAQSAFEFAAEAKATQEPAPRAARRSASRVSQEPREQRVESMPLLEQPPEVKPKGKQRAVQSAGKKSSGTQKAPVRAGRASSPAASKSEVPAPVAAEVASVVEHSVTRRPQRKDKQATMPPVERQSSPAVVTDVSLASRHSVTTAPRQDTRAARPGARQAKAQTPLTPAPKTPQPDAPAKPRTEVKKRVSEAVAAVKAKAKPSSSAEASAVQVSNVPAPSSDSSPAVAVPVQPVQIAAPVAPPTWRYVGTREEADRLYRRRFGTEDVPEPMMIAGTWAYTLPAMRRPLA